MINVENVTIINKPVEEVFAITTDPSKGTQWQDGLETVEDIKGSPGVGTQWTQVRKFMGREMRTRMEMTAYEPNKRYAIKSLNGPVKFSGDVNFEPVENGTKILNRRNTTI